MRSGRPNPLGHPGTEKADKLGNEWGGLSVRRDPAQKSLGWRWVVRPGIRQPQILGTQAIVWLVLVVRIFVDMNPHRIVLRIKR